VKPILSVALPWALLAGLLAGCASQGPPGSDPSDPFEASNRAVLEFNTSLDENIIRPAAEAYRDTVPAPMRTALRNFLRNLNEPVILANNLLQGRMLDAGHTLMRFYINSTAGGLGLFDVATASGIERRTGDFGQTLHSWGVPDGPFLMLPLFGPTTVRDAVGDGVDALASPVGLVTGATTSAALSQMLGVGRGALGGLDLRAENIETLDALRSESLDYYARLRSVVRQRRDAQLGRSNAEGEGLSTLDDPGAAPADPAAAAAPAGVSVTHPITAVAPPR
jgi:phospholipid-binding lipoprotein MlaA